MVGIERNRPPAEVFYDCYSVAYLLVLRGNAVKHDIKVPIVHGMWVDLGSPTYRSRSNAVEAKPEI